MSIEQVRIPDIGDSGEVEVIELLVAPDDVVAVDDPLIVIESDKASMEVPSTIAGRVVRLAVALGDQCSEGDVIAEIEAAASTAAPERSEATESEATEPVATEPEATETEASEPDTNASEAAASEAVVDVVVPDIGEASGVEVIEIMVAPGDVVAVDDGLVVLESDKATMEVPATAAGEVLEVALKEGDAVEEGALVARIRSADAATATPESAAAPENDAAPKSAAAPAAAPPARPAPPPTSASASTSATPAAAVYAGPAVRKLARELGVDLARVAGSGDKGRVLKEDVHGYVKAALAGAPAPAVAGASGTGIPPLPPVDFSKFGEVEEVALSRTMKSGAANLHRSWLNLPHVTQFDDADVTELEAFRKSLKPEAERAGVKLTPLPFLMKVAAAALREFPRVGGSFAADGEHYVLKKYCHVGFAVDTPDGLLVPVVRDVDRKGVFELAAEIADLSERARTKKLAPGDMQGGCFSVSSLGAIGGRGFTPIVNAPEVAILGVSRLAKQPVWNGTEFVPRDMLPLCLSYDHKAINGAEAGRFLSWYARALGDVRRLLL
ncbi:MAG: dihydrolipoyllysine-residue acetyltransferase [Pseudomonadales bacterium]|jgi:pyruvate dehydrogenase E2 component (dihydrolipoamide acetyltransferase)|nr:dihydrolipoyllysine-residue acetyltransferase [Pseudomonadales bacterium]